MKSLFGFILGIIFFEESGHATFKILTLSRIKKRKFYVAENHIYKPE